MFYGPLDKCPVCGGNLEVSDTTYMCSGVYSEWSSCTYASQDPPRRDEQIKLPDSVKDSGVADVSFSLFFVMSFEFHTMDDLLEKTLT